MKRQHIIYLIAAVSLMLPFQNCTSQTAHKAPSVSGLTLQNTSGGNGEYYGGKLSAGVYVRPLPDLKCGNEKFLATVAVNEDGSAATRSVDPVTCLVTDTQISASQLEYASYEPNRVGLDEGIYSLEDSAASKSEIEEAWCRSEGSGTRTGFDIVVKADYKTNSFSTIIVAGDIVNGNYERKVYDAPTPRRDVDLAQRVRYRGDLFRLDIDTATYDASTGKMQAEFEFGYDGADIKRNLFCRLGGELDLQYAEKPYNFAQIISLKFQSIAKHIGSLIHFVN